jgi:hypothetical protein
MVRGNSFSAQGGGFAKGIFLIATLAFVVAIPQYLSAKATATPAISEIAPSAIPAEIIADWSAQGRDDKDAAHLQRIKNFKAAGIENFQKLLFLKHYNKGGSIFGNGEDLKSDGVGNVGGKFAGISAMSMGTNYKNGSAMMQLEFKDYYPTPTPILEDASGVIRDANVWFDGTRVVFGWCKSGNGYNLYEMDLTKPKGTDNPRQLTSSPASHTVSDFEPCYCPDGNIVFISSRNFGHVDCNFNLASNLYLCNKDGKYIRRLGYDQVNIFHPTCNDAGSIVYGRWEYNDRNVHTGFGIFTMYPDGTHQTEHWGNQIGTPSGKAIVSWIPGGKGKVLCVTSQHMGSTYQGDLCLIDPAKGRNSTSAVTMIAPKGKRSPSQDVANGNRKFQDPYALNDDWFLISYTTASPTSSNPTDVYKLYLMNTAGDRELIAWDASKSCCEPFPLTPRTKPGKIRTSVRYTDSTGTVSMTDAYTGLGTGSARSASKIPKGAIKKIRAITLKYRVHPWIGYTGAQGYQATPAARYLGTWEAKKVLGEMKVESDGSAAMILPSRIPIYFQLIDSNGCAINSMRSWLTLQPGEKFDCYGCHEDKNNTPAAPSGGVIAKNPLPLQDFFGKKDFVFSFTDLIQKPIIDAKCLSCHGSGKTLDLTGTSFAASSLVDDEDNKNAEKNWLQSYWNLTEKGGTGGGMGFVSGKYCNWMDAFGQPAQGLDVYQGGSCKSALISKLRTASDAGMKAAATPEVIQTFAMWIDLCVPFGDFMEGMSDANKTMYAKRLKIRDDLDAAEQVDIQSCIQNKDASCFPSDGINVFNQPVSRTHQNASLFNVQSFANGSKLVLRLQEEGNISLMDVLGHKIMSRSIGKNAINNDITIQTKLSRGIYIVKFKGAAVTEHKVINVL